MERPGNTLLKRFLLLAMVAAMTGPACAQSQETQVWTDLTVGRNFASIYMAEVEFGYQALVQGDPQWRTFSISPTLEASFTPHLDVISGFPWMNTLQTDDVLTNEFRVQLGARYHVLPFKRVQPRITYRYEARFFNTLEPEANAGRSTSNRMRLNVGVWIALDKPLMSYDTLWYVFTDYEVYGVLDQELAERYANQSALRVAVGRKFSYNWRMEVVYSLLRYRDELDTSRDEYDRDNVFRLTFKYYFTPPGRKPPQEAP
jgi:hypothetical protein